MMKFNLGWGNSVAVRKALLETYNGDLVVFSSYSLEKFDYPAHEGDPEIIELTREVIKRQVGKDYKHILITNGATGGVVIALRTFVRMGYGHCHTRNAPFYVRYPRMVRASGMVRLNEEDSFSKQSVVLLDIPSNPLGLIEEIDCSPRTPVILDGVYLNRVYTDGNVSIPRHDVLVGSYSKLLGMNGIRVGWIATNDDIIADYATDLVTSEYCGLSKADSDIIKSVSRNLNWESFEKLAKLRLDCNREQWSKLEKFFGNTPVPSMGMFHYGPIDSACRKLLEKSEIHWTSGRDLGTNDGFGRFNLGADCRVIEDAVKTILKNDQST